MMKTCETCQHWSAPVMPEDNGYGTCEKTASFGGSAEGKVLAFAQDQDDVAAILHTKPNFGCVMYENK